MNNIKNKNKFIPKSSNNKLPLSDKGYQCIGPCYPPNTIFYHPINLGAILLENEKVCPVDVYDNVSKNKIFFDKCEKTEVTENYRDFDIFDDTIQIATTNQQFLRQIYSINTIEDVDIFLTDSIDNLPIYTRRRILNSIYWVWLNNINFPINVFVKKVSDVLKEIYSINLESSKIKKKLIENINKSKYNNIFEYFKNKYTKNK